MQVSALEEDITQVRSDLITKDNQLRELMQRASSGNQEAAAEVKKLKAEKAALQSRLECKSRQLKVSLACKLDNHSNNSKHNHCNKTNNGLKLQPHMPGAMLASVVTVAGVCHCP